MYHASEMFIIKDVLDITLNKNKTMNACYVLPAWRQRLEMLVDQKVKKFTENLPCTFAVLECRQLEDVSSVENVHMVNTEIISYVFISCCHLRHCFSIIKSCCATSIWCA